MAPDPPAVTAERLHFADPLRVFAALGIICIHVSNEFLNLTDDRTARVLGRLLEAYGRWAVPGFFMLTGALLINEKRESMGVFYRRRLQRIAIPITIWTAIYFIVVHSRLVDAAPPNSVRQLGYDAARAILTGRPDYHMWYVYALGYLYLFIPFARTWWQNASIFERRLGATLALGLAMFSAISWAGWGFRGWAFPPGNPLSSVEWVFYIGYALLGAVLRDVKLSRRAGVGLMTLGGLLIVVNAALELLALAHGQAIRAEILVNGPFSPLVMLMSVAIYLGFMATISPASPSASWRFTSYAGLATLGVYLSHLLFLRLAFAVPQVTRAIADSPTAMLLALVTGITIVSFAFSMLLLRFKFSRPLVGG